MKNMNNNRPGIYLGGNITGFNQILLNSCKQGRNFKTMEEVIDSLKNTAEQHYATEAAYHTSVCATD